MKTRACPAAGLILLLAFSVHLPARAEDGGTSLNPGQAEALFQQALEKTVEAAQGKDGTSDAERAGTKADLENFLTLATSLSAGDYAALSQRDLQEDRWTARVILGEEAAVLNEIPPGDAASRERFHLLRALLYPKIRPEQADANLKAMADFLNAFPESENGPEVELGMAGVALREGERLVQARGTAAAAPYLDFAGERFGQLVADDDAGIADAAVWEAREGLLRTCFWQKDHDNLAAWTEYIVSVTKPGDMRWSQAKLFDAMALARQEKYGEAVPVLDEVVDSGFTGEPAGDDIAIAAVRLRILAAMRTGDPVGIGPLVQRVRNSGCEKGIKQAFVHEYEWVNQ
jgi:hypothetical protein